MKKLLIALIVILFPIVSNAAQVPMNRTGTTISPLYLNDDFLLNILSGFGTRCVQVDNTGKFGVAASACGTGGGGSGSGSWATTTSNVPGRLINYPLNATDIVTIGKNSTTSAPFYFDPNTLTSLLNGLITINRFTATGTIASILPYASTTMTTAEKLQVNYNNTNQANSGLVINSTDGTASAQAVIGLHSNGTLRGDLRADGNGNLGLDSSSTGGLDINYNSGTGSFVYWGGTTVAKATFGNTGNMTLAGIATVQGSASSTFTGGIDAARVCITGTTKCLDTELTASTTLLADNNTFSGTVNNFLNKLGIGTSTPAKTLAVNGPAYVADDVTMSHFHATSTTATSEIYGQLKIGTDSTDGKTGISMSSTSPSWYQGLSVQNYGTGAQASSDIAVCNDKAVRGTSCAKYLLNVGINASNNTDTANFPYLIAGQAYVISTDQAIWTGTSSTTAPNASTTYQIGTAGVTRLTVTGAGLVGIGTTTPSSLFTLGVQGNGLFSGNVTLANLFATGTVTTAANQATSTFGSAVAHNATTTFNANVGFTIASSSAVAASYTVNWRSGTTQRFIVNQASNFIINATSSSPIDGGKYILKICQDPGGARAVTFVTPEALRWPSITGTTTVSQTANMCTWIGMIYDASATKYSILASTTVPIK